MFDRPEVKTKRLRLNPISANDLDIYKALLMSPETTRYLPGGKPFSEDYITNYLEEKIAHWEKGYGTFVISLADNPATKIGYAGVETIPDSEFNDVRYALLPGYQGRGFALEAASAVVEFIFSNTGLSEIYGVAVTENLPSVRLLEKLGMTGSRERLYDSNDLVTLSVNREHKGC